MVYHPGFGYHYLFYSSNPFDTPVYNVAVARSKALLGPYEKLDQPILHSNDKWIGPGHCSVVPGLHDRNHWVMIYHSWAGHVGGNNIRLMLMDQIQWTSEGWPSIDTGSPSTDKKPVP
jgi:beta-xylosidase